MWFAVGFITARSIQTTFYVFVLATGCVVDVVWTLVRYNQSAPQRENTWVENIQLRKRNTKRNNGTLMIIGM